MSKIHDIADLLIKIIGLMIGAFGVYQYFLSVNQARIDRTLSYYDMYHTGRLLDARESVNLLFIRITTSSPADSTVDDAIASGLSTNEMKSHYDIIVEFFDRLYYCVKENACDGQTSRSLFSREADYLRRYLYLRTEKLRKIDSSHAVGLLCLAHSDEIDKC